VFNRGRAGVPWSPWRLLPVAVLAAAVALAGTFLAEGVGDPLQGEGQPPPSAEIAAMEPAAEASTPARTPRPSQVPSLRPAPAPVDSPTPSPTPDATPAPIEISPQPAASPGPASIPRVAVAQPALPTHRVATRVVVPALRIDLPVTRQTTSYPACNVAMYLKELKQPGQGGVTYLYSHARTGNFLPLLEESRIADGRRMIGMTVLVYTGDNHLFTYRISEVRRHVTDFAPAFAWRGESVWLQTSEGPRGTAPKLQVVAEFVRSQPTDYASAHPVPRPVSCS
jgi:hypothetical protein